MTREEALQRLRMLHLVAEEPEDKVAILMAIQALKQPEQQRGEWVKDKSFMYCSICGAGFDVYFNRDFLFCPNCGAKMEGEE